jgi:hypothetical protein
MRHVGNLLIIFGYCCRVHDCTVFHFFQFLFQINSPSRDPRITHFLFLVTVIWSCVKVTVHPLSHNCPTDMSEL